jgi:hypothetical protein
MRRGVDLPGLRRALKADRYSWQRHALERAMERGMEQAVVVAGVATGEVIEDYPDDYPLPSALLLAKVGARAVHIVVAWDATAEWGYIITVYVPDEEHFEADGRTRRQP